MSTRYKGSILSSTAASSSSTAAYGLWKQSEVAQLILSAWPVNDPSWANVSMLLHGDGTVGAQNNTFIDSSSNAFSITRNGSTTQGSVNPFGSVAPYTTTVGGGSAYFNGTTDYLTIPANTAFSYTTGDFTWECWIYPLAYGAAGSVFFDFFSNTSGSYIIGQCQLYISSTGLVQFFYANTINTGLNISSVASVTLNAWSHIAVVRSGSSTGNLKLYVNGALAATSAGAVTQNLGSTGAGSIGKQTSGTPYYYNGYVSNVRIVKGTAVYTTAFTPPTAPLTAISGTSLLLGFTNAGVIDNAMQNNIITVGTTAISTFAYKYSTGAITFSGTGAWLTAPDITALQLGTGDFTIEGWVGINATGTAYGIVSKGAAATGWSVNITSGNKLQFSYTASNLTGATSLVAGAWYYFSVVRSGSGTGNLKIYLNGTADATSAGAVTDNFNQTSILYVGASRTGTTPLNGYIDELRITKGVARYTADFTAPQQAFPSQ